MPASAMIVEHSEIVRKGMLSILKDSGLFYEIRELACSANMLEMIRRYQPDVIFVNPSVIDLHFRERIAKNDYTPRLAAMVYGFHDEPMMAVFDEVIPVNDTHAKILKKLHRLIRNETRQHGIRETQLSERELDVLKLLVQGLSNKEISEKLFISVHTVISHRKNIVQKLNIRSVAGLTVYAILNGIATAEDLK